MFVSFFNRMRVLHVPKLLIGGFVAGLMLFSCSQNPLSVDNRQTLAVAEVAAPIHHFDELPAQWNGSLVVYAHGFVPTLLPLSLPAEYVQFSTLAKSAHFAFATTSYPSNGMCIPEALSDLQDLVAEFRQQYPQTQKVFLIGASMGGLIAAQAAEEHPETFDGVLAMCGVYGSYPVEAGHISDFRIVFDYFFPGVLPGDARSVPLSLMVQWQDLYMPNLMTTFTDPANSEKVRQLLTVTKLPVDKTDPASVVSAMIQVLAMQVFATEDVKSRLGGYPYGNSRKWYCGSDNDRNLNAGVQRFPVDYAAVRAANSHFGTTGRLKMPLVSLHGTGDNLVPITQQRLYRHKIICAHTSALYHGISVQSYGHCRFAEQDLLSAFSLLVTKVTGVAPQMVSSGDPSVCISCK